MPATSCSPRSSASAARPSSTGQRQQLDDGLGRRAIRRSRATGRARAPRRPRCGAPPSNSTDAISSERGRASSRPRRRTSRPASPRSPTPRAARATISSSAQVRHGLGRARRGPGVAERRVGERRRPAPAPAPRPWRSRPGRPTGTAGPCRRRGCAPTTPGPACSRASPRTTARARAPRGSPLLALPDELRDAVDTGRRRRRAATASTSSTRSSGMRATNSRRVEVGLRAQPGERVPDVGGERIDLERGQHLGGRRVDRRRRDTSRGRGRYGPTVTDAGNQRSVGSVTRAEQRAGRVDLAELQVRGRVEQVAEVGAGRVLADDLGPDAHLPRSTTGQEDARRRTRPPRHRIAGSSAPSAAIWNQSSASSSRRRARNVRGAVEGFVARGGDVVGGSHALSIGTRRPIKAHRSKHEARASRAHRDNTRPTAQVPRRTADLVARSPRAEQGRLAIACQDGRTAEGQLVLDLTMQAIQTSLDGLAARQRIDATNLANSETPGYTAQTVNFEDSLSAALAERRSEPGADHDRRHAPTRRTSTATTSPSTPRRSR